MVFRNGYPRPRDVREAYVWRVLRHIYIPSLSYGKVFKELLNAVSKRVRKTSRVLDAVFDYCSFWLIFFRICEMENKIYAEIMLINTPI